MLRTPLHQFHVDHKASLVDFAGWEMPILYSGIQEEHKQVRTRGGLFDVSHMGRVRFSGRHARRLLERLCTRKIMDMDHGQCRYSLVCNEQGGVRDDVIVYRIDDDEFLVVVNASNREKLLGHFEQVRAASDFAVKIKDETMDSAMIALQGPKVMDLVSKFSKEIPTLKRYRFTTKNLLIVKIIVSRTGYTGEDGVEAILPASAVSMAMKMMLQGVPMDGPDAVIKPIGLGARDTLRLEAGMPLYGHELGEEINALSCGVDFAIAMDKDQMDRGEKFIGLDALRKTQSEGGPKHKLVGLEIVGKRAARQGMKVRSGGKEIGVVTSGAPSPTLEKCIAMAFVDVEHTPVGTALQIDPGGDRGALEATVVAMPFYKAPKPQPKPAMTI